MSDAPHEPAASVLQAQDRFVQAWGQMAGAWGVSRTMAEAHALLYITGEPLNSDDVMRRLRISRGNASMTLRALLDWGLISRVHKRGDRKEYFAAEQDVWAILRTILRERKKRELDPLLVSLHETRDLTSPSRAGAAAREPATRAHNARLDAMLAFVTLLDGMTDRLIAPDNAAELRAAAEALAHPDTADQRARSEAR